MALNFPSSPTDGDTFEGYIYRSATDTWDYNETTPDSLTLSTVRLTSTTDITSASSTGHAFQIGADGEANLRIDQTEIQAANNGVVSNLFLNNVGGNVTIGVSTSTVTIAGSTQLGLEETQKVVDVEVPVGGYTYANNTYTVNLASGNYFTNITTQRVYNSSSGWTIVGSNNLDFTGTSATHTLISSGTAAQGDVAIVVVSGDWTTNNYPTTSSSGWSTNTAAATTYGSAVFWKTMGATPDTTIAITSGSAAGDKSSIVSTMIRSSDILPAYIVSVATPARANATTGVPTPPATTTLYPNTLVVVAGTVRNDIVDVAQSSVAPAGYSNYIISSSGVVAGTAASAMLATKFVATVSTETPGAFAPKFANGVAVSDYSSAWTFQIAAYADATITLDNPSLSATYPASTYVLHINNPNALTTTTWTGQTFAWQGGSAPTLSSTAPNNIVILETINGTTFRGALLDSYA